MSHDMLSRIDEIVEVLLDLRCRAEAPLRRAVDILAAALREGHAVYTFGNGGSAADAQHIAGELVGRFKLNRPAYNVRALTADSSVLTCVANDFDFDSIYARQLEAYGKPGDIAVGLSTSGRSGNVIRGLQAARRLGMGTLFFTGRDAGAGGEAADAVLSVPAGTTAHVQEGHVVLYHIICEEVEKALA